MKRLGFGMMRLPMPDPKVQGVVDREAVCGMVDAFLERGFTYFYTAYMYALSGTAWWAATPGRALR